MQAKLGDLTKEAGKVGLAVNVKKTKALRVNTNKKEPLSSGMKVLRMWQVLYTWVARSPKMERPRRTWHKESKKQMVFLYNSIQYGETTIYLLGPNFASSVTM
jgi:hypothetical protein